MTCYFFSFYHQQLLDLNLFGRFKSIAIISIVKLKLFYLWPVGAYSIRLLNIFDMNLVISDDFLAIKYDEIFQAHLIYILL